jgi:CBS domain-containing protein
MDMTIYEILRTKGSHVHVIHPEATLDEAIRTMTRHNVGSLLACQRDVDRGEQIVGILSERDVLRFCAADRGPPVTARVSDVMTRNVLVSTPTDAVQAVLGLMTRSRVRHMPVVSEGRLVGIVSIGDLVKAQLDHLTMENRFMKNYIGGETGRT